MSLFKVEEMKCGRLDDSYAFTPNCSGLLAFALGVTLTSAPKLVPRKAVQSSYRWLYKTSCVSVILSKVKEQIYWLQIFLFPQTTHLIFFSLRRSYYF